MMEGARGEVHACPERENNSVGSIPFGMLVYNEKKENKSNLSDVTWPTYIRYPTIHGSNKLKLE
jgi:hypothetical protein